MAFNVETSPIPDYFRSHWNKESTLFRVLGSTMANVQFKNPAVFAVFDEMMYQNRYGDLLLSRTSGDRESQLFIETWQYLPQRIDSLKEKNIKAGSSEESNFTIDSWFSINRILNFASKELYEKGTVSWENYSRQNEFYNTPSDELTFLNTIEQSFNTLNPQDPDYKRKCSLLFRSMSSHAFIYTLTSVAEKDTVDIEKNRAKFRRLGSMIMVAQILDDFSSPAKDVNHHILGTIAAEFSESRLSINSSLHISSADALKAIKRARNILSASLNHFGVKKGTIQREIIKYALYILGGLSVPHNSSKYGGSYYPKVSTIVESAKELLLSKTEIADTAAIQELLDEGMYVVERLFSHESGFDRESATLA